jgi:hypothetical protein
MAAGMKMPMTNLAEIDGQLDSPEKFITGKMDAAQLAAASVSSGQFEGEVVDIIATDKIQYFFSRSSHLLVGEKQTTAAGVTLTKYKSYTNYSGLLLPATVITETKDLSSTPDIQALAGSKPIPTNTQTAPEKENMAIGFFAGSRPRSTKKKQKTDSENTGFTGAAKTSKHGQGLIAVASELSAANLQNGQQNSAATNLKTLKEAFGSISSGSMSTTTVRIISVQLNVPVSDADFN